MKRVLLFFFGILCFQQAHAQEIFFGTNQYIEYQRGNLPIVFSVPHGGDLAPASIPDRTCNNPTLVTDLNTIAVGRAINEAFHNLTGCYPHIIYCHLDRPKLDCNRTPEDGTCGNLEAWIAWNEYHNFIDTALQLVEQEFDDATLFMDIHGHGHPIQRVEMGYLLNKNELAETDAELNTAEFVSESSIQDLVNNNSNNLTHSELLRGELALGTLLGNRGFPAVPSEQIPEPGIENSFFSGGYITKTYTSFSSESDINGVQMELNYTGIRNNAENRALFATALAEASIEYLEMHRELETTSCLPTATTSALASKNFTIYPNPFPVGNKSIFIKGEIPPNSAYQIFNYMGQVVSSGNVRNNQLAISTDLSTGIYFLQLHLQGGVEFEVISVVKN